MNGPFRFARSAGSTLTRHTRRVGAIAWRAVQKFDETDGEQRAASFAYYAFFSMFPLILLLITIGTSFLGPKADASSKIIAYVSTQIPLEEQDMKAVISTINGVVQSRKSAGFIAIGVLFWTSLRFFQALVRGVNRAWGTKEYSWWRLPIKNLGMLGILTSVLFLGIIAPVVLKQVEDFYWFHSRQVGLDFSVFGYVFQFARLLIPVVVLFIGMSLFFKYAPRRPTRFIEVWSAALFVTISLELLQRLFVLYTRNIGNFNALYGTFGSVVALLLWIYLSGSIIILGGCISAARYEIDMSLADQSESDLAK
ncbi:MAG: YihY/virulence factor BrkB family protein [Verrucomicrobia bacterium]|nr:MAG: YihY/virulence factor BrkB family protein [Verrucomicrobiota bacterium]